MSRKRLLSHGLQFLLAAASALLLAGCPSSKQATRCGPPTVDAGEDLQAKVGDTVILSASLRLPPESEQLCIDEKASVTFRWEQLSGPDVELEGANQPQASFTPSEPGSYSFRCQATYPVTAANPTIQVSQWDTVQVEVTATACPPPVADAGDDQTLSTLAGQPVTVTLDGSGSQPGSGVGCSDVTLQSYAWTQLSGPQVTIENADQAQASVELSEFGIYQFQLQVQDSGGTEDGRSDTASDTVNITLVERSPCQDTLAVTVVAADSGQPLPDVTVTVVDADGQSHQATTDASGLASFDGLADGTRRSITAVSPEKVPPLPGAAGSERNKYEVTTVLEHCSSTLTIPLQLTDSGRAALPRGVIKAKIPQNIWDMLPHSYRCAGSCSSDADCDNLYSPGTYYCEAEANACQGSCTPRSLLPFFSLGGGQISGQMRVVILTDSFDLQSLSRFPVARLFASPPTADAILPGNLTSDDTFLNGLASSLGLDPYGDICDSVSDCPDNINWICDYDAGRCKDIHPLRNVHMEVPAGNGRTLALVGGVMYISMIDLLPILLPFLESTGQQVSFDVASFMAAFKMKTLFFCPLHIDIAAGTTTDISSRLQALGPQDCFLVDYQQRDDVVALVDPNLIDPSNTCDPQNDHCTDVRPDLKCLANPDSPQDYYCLIPLYQVTIISNDQVNAQVNLSGFDPTTSDADTRLCNQLPASARHEVKCDADQNGLPETCEDEFGNPTPVYCDVSLDSVDVDCGFPFGLSLAAVEVPPGNQLLPSGGRLVVGFDFNRTPIAFNQQPTFLMPSREGALADTGIALAQLFFRNLVTHKDFSYFLLPGRMGSWALVPPGSDTVNLPPLLDVPAAPALPEAPFSVNVHFIPDDPLADCDTVQFEHVYAITGGMEAPGDGYQLPLPPWQAQSLRDAPLHGVLLSLVDRPQVGEDRDLLSDSYWRVYAPAGTDTFDIPWSLAEPPSGQEVLLSLWASAFRGSFDYDLFSTAQVLGGERVHTADGWFLAVP